MKKEKENNTMKHLEEPVEKRRGIVESTFNIVGHVHSEHKVRLEHNKEIPMHYIWGIELSNERIDAIRQSIQNNEPVKPPKSVYNVYHQK